MAIRSKVHKILTYTIGDNQPEFSLAQEIAHQSLGFIMGRAVPQPHPFQFVRDQCRLLDEPITPHRIVVPPGGQIGRPVSLR
jgi:hypothetical protein